MNFIVGTDGAGNYGYKAGEYGNLVGGQFPGELFNDGQPRDIEAIYETPDGKWVFIYADSGMARSTQTDLGYILLGLIPLSLGLLASGRMNRLPFSRHKANQ